MKKLLILLILCGALFLTGCYTERPPEDGTPDPDPLSGTFAYASDSYQDTLTFNGDGRSIWLNLSEELAAKTGLPAGKQTGTYVFLFHNEEYRYDKAEYFQISVGEEHYRFSALIGRTDGNTVAFYTPDGEPVVFNILFD